MKKCQKKNAIFNVAPQDCIVKRGKARQFLRYGLGVDSMNFSICAHKKVKSGTNYLTKKMN